MSDTSLNATFDLEDEDDEIAIAQMAVNQRIRIVVVLTNSNANQSTTKARDDSTLTPPQECRWLPSND